MYVCSWLGVLVLMLCYLLPSSLPPFLPSFLPSFLENNSLVMLCSENKFCLQKNHLFAEEDIPLLERDMTNEEGVAEW